MDAFEDAIVDKDRRTLCSETINLVASARGKGRSPSATGNPVQ